MAELKNTSTEDLQKKVTEMRESLRTFRFGESGGRTRNVREGRNLRRDIARHLTEINRRLAEERKNA